MNDSSSDGEDDNVLSVETDDLVVVVPYLVELVMVVVVTMVFFTVVVYPKYPVIVLSIISVE